MKKCLIEDRHETMECTHCPLCGKKVNKSSKEKSEEECAKLPHELKQKFIDLIHEGRTIGYAKEQCGVTDTMVACEIINENIGTFHFINKEAV